MSRPLLFSCALHVAIALIALASTRRAPVRERPLFPEQLAPAALVVRQIVDVEVTAGGGGPPHRREPAVVPWPRALRLRPVPSRLSAIAEVPPEAPPQPQDLPETASTVEVPPPTQGDNIAAPSARPGGEATGSGEGDAAGDGVGSGRGAGIGLGGGPMGRELHARVLGGEPVRVDAREGMPIASHDEATALRSWDTFPRLPEAVWPGGRPYVVKLQVCVGADGLVTEAVLRSSASWRLDPIVRAAVETWRYRPRVVGGKPAPFCHGVAIKYEHW
jgi:hypothetical protein